MSDLRIEFNPPQSAAYQCIKPGNTVALAFGRGLGKSWFLRTLVYLLVAEWDYKVRPGAETPGVRIVILMPTLEQFRKVHLALMLGEIDERWKFLGAKINLSAFKISFPGGSWVQVVSAEAAQGARGIRCDVIFPDEADDIDPEIVEAITQPWFTEPHSLRITVIAGTPKRGRYGLLYRAFKYWPNDPELAATHFSFHATSYDAPKHVDRKYIDQIRKKTDPRVFRREYLADFDSAEGLVYDMFDENFHVGEPDPRIRWTEMLVGQDWGYEDPGVQLLVGVQGSGADAVCWVLEETYEQHRTLDFWVANTKRIKEMVRTKYRDVPIHWYADPSQPASIAQISRDASVRIQPAENAIEDGVSAVADRLLIRTKRDENEKPVGHYAKLMVHRKCTNMIREFGLYRRKRDPRNSERVLDDISDKDNHATDSLRYAIFSRFGKPPAQRIEYGAGLFQRG